MISTLWTNLQNAIAGAERIFDFMAEEPDVQNKPDAIEMPPIEGRVELRDVWMSYNEDEPVLEGVSLTAEPGRRSPSSARPARARRRSSTCCRVSTTWTPGR